MDPVKSLGNFLLMAVLYVFVLVVSVLLLPVLSMWRIVVKCLTSLRYKNAIFFNGLDAVFTFGSTTRETNMLINFYCKGSPDFKKIQALVRDKMALKYQRFRYFIKPVLGYHVWLEEEHFSIDDHVIWQSDMDIRTYEELDKVAQLAYMKPMHPMKSPWKIVVVPLNSRFDNSEEQPRYCIFLVFHHSLTDGYSIAVTMRNTFSDDNEENFNIPVPKRIPSPSLTTKVKTIIKMLLLFPYIFVETFLLAQTMYSSDLLSGKIVNVQAGKIKTQKLKRIKNAMGVNFTAVFVSCSIAAIQKFAERRNLPLPTKGMAVFGIPLWKAEDLVEPKNKFIAFPMQVPLIENGTAKQRLKAVRDVFNDDNSHVRFLFHTIITKYISVLLPNFVGRFIYTRMPAACAIAVGGQTTEKEMPVCGNGNVSYKVSCTVCLHKLSGIGFSYMTVGDDIHIYMDIDTKLMTKEEMQKMSDDILDEIEELYQCIQ